MALSLEEQSGYWIIQSLDLEERFIDLDQVFFGETKGSPPEIDDIIIYNYHCLYWNIEMAIWEGLKLLSLPLQPLHWREHILGGFIGRKIMKNLDMFGASN